MIPFWLFTFHLYHESYIISFYYFCLKRCIASIVRLQFECYRSFLGRETMNGLCIVLYSIFSWLVSSVCVCVCV